MKNIINILPENVANQIAAGEVVQRPASVLKELLENSIDAGSTEIHIEIKNAGKTSILVFDDGIGMTKEDAEICFNRHATSKISSAIDLFNIKSKGFRGEALASIAAIAHVQLISKQRNDQLGTQIDINGSQLVANKSVVAEDGTKILVKNLFFNIPARRKFLKSNNVENKHLMNEFFRVSLSHPEVNFIFLNEGKEIYNLKTSTFKKRIIELFGNKTNEKLVPINEETEILRLNGFIFKPEFSKKTRGQQYFFVNNRFIKSPYLNHAVKVAFEGLIDTNYNPSYFLNLHVDPKTIDINIHPTKTEIKFEDEHSIYAILRSSIKHSLGQYNISPILDFERDKNLDIPYYFDKKSSDGSMSIEVNSNYNPFKKNKTISLGNANHNFEKDGHTLQFASDSEDFTQLDFNDINSSANTNQIIQFNKKYIINKTKSSLVVINQERAHQRILYEKFLKLISSNKKNAQKLLYPSELEYNSQDIRILKSNYDQLKIFGIEFNFNENSIIISSLPSFLNEKDLKLHIDNLLYNLQNETPINNFSESDLFSKILSKSMSIKNGKILDTKELEYIINSLFACKEASRCPFNKKTFIKINANDIENMFK